MWLQSKHIFIRIAALRTQVTRRRAAFMNAEHLKASI